MGVSPGWPKLCLAALGMYACQTQTPRGTEYSVRDSAGVRIVENGSSVTGATEWRVGESPVVQIGSLEEEAEYQLHEVSDALRLSDGRIVVASGGTNDLRFYSSHGAFLSSVGGTGEGPGEFRGLVALERLPADSLLAYDQRLRRVSYFDSDGTFLRSTSLELLQGAAINGLIGRFADGSLAITATGAAGPEPVDEGAVARDPMLFLRHFGGSVDTLASLPGPEKTVGLLGETRVILSVPLGRTTLHAFQGDRLFVGNNEAYDIKVLGPDGSVALIVRAAHRPLPVVKDEVLRLLGTQLLAEVDDESLRSVLERMLANISLPETLPAFAWLIADTAGNLWVREHTLPDDDANPWTVFGSDGAMIARVSLAHRFQPFQIGGDFLLGRWTDDLGIEYVQMYSLTK